MGSLIERSEKDAFSGFYYDAQISSPELTMTLHPNTLYTGEPPLYWDLVENLGETERDSDGYLKDPIAKAIITEDFQLAAGNSWEDGGIMDDLTGLFNQVKGMAPFADYVSQKFSGMTRDGEPVVGNTGDDTATAVQGALNKVPGALSGLLQKASQYANRALVVQGTRFSMYNGSNVAFSNMVMKYTLFSDWGEDGVFRSCIDKIKGNTDKGEPGILNYVVGKYVTWNSEEGTNGPDGSDNDKEIWNQFLGWQIPPGGFKADLKNIDNIQMGTLKIVFGGMYAIHNLVIQDAQFTFSKQMIKVPDSSNLNSVDIAPMYCDVQLTLKPASKYTANSIIKAIDGSAERRDILKSEINQRLDLESKSIAEQINQQVSGGPEVMDEDITGDPGTLNDIGTPGWAGADGYA